ncbi:MAG: protein kinase [Burkholderiales bacterium]|nr:protein kinase [Burkholderiales bacterium]
MTNKPAAALPVDASDWAEVSPWFDRALDAGPLQLTAWLDALPPAMARHRELLRRLLLDHAQVETDDFLGRGAGPATTPRDIGPYRLLRELGRGGMASVWLAERRDAAPARPVALKLPHAGLATGAFAERLRRERDILAALAHPHIARLFDAGISAEGQPYIALEYVEGRSIVEACDAARQPPRSRVALFGQVLDAVQHAHARLVIHRDLKPSNVLVDDEGRVRLLDFGIAKVLVDGRGEATELTLDRGAAMTLDYASPEQVAGLPLGTASDIYSLGVLLYELLAGRRPYHLSPLPPAELVQAMQRLDIAAPSAVAGDEAAAARGLGGPALRRELRGDLDSIVLKALKPRPQDRYETAAAFRADLERWLRGDTVLARPDSRAYRLRKFVGRHRWAVAGVAASTLAIGTASIGYALQAREALRERDYARAMADRSDATARFLNDLLVEAAQGGKPVSLAQLLERSEQLVARSYQDNPDHRAAVLDTLANYYVTVGQQAKGADLMAQAVALAASSPDPALLDQLRCNQAFAESKLGHADAARRTLQQTLTHEFRDPRVRVVCTLYLSFIGHDLHDREASLRYARQALEQLRAQDQPLPELEAELLGNLGTAYQDNGRSAEAALWFDRALQKYRALGRDRGPVAMTVRNNWSSMLTEAGDPRAALALLDEMVDDARRGGGAAPPLYVYANRAHGLRFVGRYAEAKTAYEALLAAAREHDAVPLMVSAWAGLSAVAREQGDLVASARDVAQAQALLDARGPAAAGAAARLRFERALLDLAQGRAEPARAALQALLAQPAAPAAEVATLTALARAETATGHAAEAVAHARRAVALGESLQGGRAASNRTGGAWLELGRALAATHDGAGAADALHHAQAHLGSTVEPAQAQRAELQRLLAGSPA